MRSKIAERILKNIPDETKLFVKKYAALAVLINYCLDEKGYSQKKLADNLGKRPSEINKWLNGQHNFTLRSICKLEVELGITLLSVPEKKTNFVFEQGVSYSNQIKTKVFYIKPDRLSGWQNTKLRVVKKGEKTRNQLCNAS